MLDKNQLLEILNDWNFWKNSLEAGMPRQRYLGRAMRFLKPNVVLAITGPRRSGKSFLMRQIARQVGKKDPRDTLIVNFEDPRFSSLSPELLSRIFEAYRELVQPQGIPFIFLDEVHRVPHWERWVRAIHELKKAKVAVSGSSAELLSGELATLLTGRHLDIVLYPLSFAEFLQFKGVALKDSLDKISKKTEIKRLLGEYLEFGGFPEVVLHQEKLPLLLAYVDDILVRDIERRHGVRESEKLKSLAKMYLSNISSLITFNSLQRHVGLSTDTIEKFSSYFEDAHLLFFVKRFSFKVKDQEKAPRKVYSVDTGAAYAAGFHHSTNRGKAIENVVAISLKMRTLEEPSTEVYYWHDSQHREVDFVVKKGRKVDQLIQVCWDIGSYGAKEREVNSLIRAGGELRCRNLAIITLDAEGEERWKGEKIKYFPLWKWLLDMR